jgi:hypothetical protein
MIKDKHIRLMHGEIDGVNSAEETRELDDFLEENSDARQYYKELRDVGRLFEEAGQVDPPEELTEKILALLPHPARKKAGRSYLEKVRSAFRPTPAMRPAFAFAAGLVVGLCLFAACSLLLFKAGGLDLKEPRSSRIYGTIGATGDRGRLLSEQCVQLEFEQVWGGACVEHTEHAVEVHLGLSADSEIRVLLEHDEKLHFEGYSALDDGDHTLEVNGNATSLTHSGDCDYTFVFRDERDAGSPLNLRVFSEDKLVFEKSIRPDGE